MSDSPSPPRIRSVADMTADQQRRWVEARQRMFKAVLRSPVASEFAKQKARKKLNAVARYQ